MVWGYVWGTYGLHGLELGDIAVCEDSNLWCGSACEASTTKTRLALQAFMFLRSMPISRVTPSPKRRLLAATYEVLRDWTQRDKGKQQTSKAYSRSGTGVAS